MNYEKEKVCGWHDAHIGLCTSVIKMLRKRKLIEGRNPHLYVSKRIFMKNLWLECEKEKVNGIFLPNRSYLYS